MALTQEKMYTVDDIYALPDGQREERSNQYTFDEDIPVCIYEGFQVNIAALLS